VASDSITLSTLSCACAAVVCVARWPPSLTSLFNPRKGWRSNFYWSELFFSMRPPAVLHSPVRLSVCLSLCSITYKDALKVNMKQCNIDPSALSSDTHDRSAWRTLCHAAVTQFEDSRVEALEHKRAVQKRVQPRSNLGVWPRDNCSRVCSSRIGLHAH